MSKVKINPKYPDNPGMVDEKFRFHTLEWDMLDDVSRFPTKAMMQHSPSSSNSPFHLRMVERYNNGVEFIGGDWEDLAGSYRSERDKRWNASLNYHRSLITRMPFQLRNQLYGTETGFRNQTVSEYGEWESSEHEKTHFIFPSMEDGSNNYPLLYPGGVGQPYAYVNSTHEFKEVAYKVLPSLKFRDIYFYLMFVELESLPGLADGVLANKARTITNFEGNESIDKATAYFQNQYALANLKLDKATYISAGAYENQLDEEIVAREAYSNSIVFDYESVYDNAEMSFMWEYISGGQQWLRNNPEESIYSDITNRKSLFDIFGESELHFLPGVKYIHQLANIPGEVGQCISVYEDNGQGDHHYAWDPINEEWSAAFYNGFISEIYNRMYYTIAQYGWASSGKLQELTFAMKPFTWSNHHLPCLWIFDGVKTNIEKVVVDFSALNS